MERALAARHPAGGVGGRMRGGGRANGTLTRLVTTYFDTPDHSLARQGVALRVRESGGRFIQSVKADYPAAAAAATTPSPLARGEWEDPIGSAAPDPQAPTTGRFFGPGTAARLEPLFRTEVARRTIVLTAARETRIEAAIDRGHIRTSNGRAASEPISEIELELKNGDTAALYDVALDLLDAAPIRLERRSKAERGYRLLSPETVPVKAEHASPVRIEATQSGHQALQRIGLACLDHILRNEPAALAGLGEAIHQMRVGIRRLRAMLSAFGRMLPAEQRRWASAELRWLADALGAARDIDVFERALLAPARRALDGAGAPGVAALQEAAERQRKAAYVRAGRAIRSKRYTGSLLHLLRWFEIAGWRTPDGAGVSASAAAPAALELDAPIALLAARIIARRRRVAKRRSNGFARQSATDRHRLRIALKKLRYATEGLASLYDTGEIARFIKRLKRLQDDLGEANDVQVGRRIIAGLAKGNRSSRELAGAGKAVLEWHEHRLAGHEPKLRKHLDRLFAADRFWST